MYIEFDRSVTKVEGKGTRYLQDLKKSILKDGLLDPVILAVSKVSGRAYLFEGNHRMVVMKELKAEWVPVKVNYLFFNQDDDTRY